jgi:MraZ protein
MAFFSSEFECKLDAKGRLMLPARLKAGLPESAGNELILRRGFEPCLVLYPFGEYKKIYGKIASLSEFNEEYRNLQRNFFRGNVQLELDNNGRILIPKGMLSYAGIDREAMLVGMGNRIEIWEPQRYEEFLIQDPGEFSKLAEKYLAE